MKISKWFKNIQSGLSKSFERFPPAIAFSIITTIIMIILNHNNSFFSQIYVDRLKRFALTCALGVPLSLCITLTLERFQIKYKRIKYLSYLCCLLLLIFNYFFLLKDFEMVSITRYIAVSISLYLAFIYIPFIFTKRGLEAHVIKLLSRFFTTVLYSIILFLGVSAILFTINKLLLINISGKLYIDLYIVILGIFTPCFFLTGVPDYNKDIEVHEYPKLLKLLLIYILMPLLSTYTIILYLYFIKVIITLKWPIQLVMHLVLWYSLIVTSVVFLTTILMKESKWVCSFNKMIEKFILPLILMLFIALGKRVHSYGITESRYIVLIIGLWVLSIMIYLNFTKEPNNNILPFSLSLLILLSVFGPWSCYNISEHSQSNRLKSILNKYAMLSMNSIKSSKTEVSTKDKIEITNIISYFSNSHKLSDVSFLPKNFKISDMKKVFGFEGVYAPYNNINNIYFSYYAPSNIHPIDIKPFDYFIALKDNNSVNYQINDNVKMSYDNNTRTLTFSNGKSTIYSTQLSNYAKKLFEKYGTNNKNDINPEDMVFVDENNRIMVKYYLLNINGHNDKNSDQINVDYLELYMLVKTK